MSTSSVVQICNIALGWLGSKPITSLNDRSRTAELCLINYEPIRDAVLETRCWTFAEARATSTTQDVPGSPGTNHSCDEGYPEWGDGWVHTIPDCMLTVFRVYLDRDISKPRQAEWTRHNQYIIANSENVHMWGVRAEANPTRYTNLFVQALAARIAADLCIPITQNQKLQVDMWNLYEAKLREAAARDGAQSRSEEIYADRLVRARFR
jgi:hypothetical protein